MDEPANVAVHESAFPSRLIEQLAASLRARALEHKFLYLGLKQTLKWLALHEAHSPARHDPATAALYDQAFAAAGERASASILHVTGLAAGGGQKEAALLESLRARGKTVFFTPCDISLEMALTAYERAASRLKGLQCAPIVCDLARCPTLPALLKGIDPGGTRRLATFFGTIHNFAPGDVLPKILNIVRTGDLLLLGANLAPEDSYDEAIQRILPQYRNPETEEWLLSFLAEIGITPADGRLEVDAAEAPGLPGLSRIEMRFRFHRAAEAIAGGERIRFQAGEALRLFFSIRYTRTHIRRVLEAEGFTVARDWLSPSGEEGIFLCERAA